MGTIRSEGAAVAIAGSWDLLGLSPPEEPKPPPAAHEAVPAPVNGEGRETEDALRTAKAVRVSVDTSPERE